MCPNKMKEILYRIKSELSADEYSVGEGASESRIGEAEHKLSLSFPEEYREFLKVFGWLEVYNSYFFGVPDNLLGEGSVVKMTLYAREQWALPTEFLALYSSEDKIAWCLSCKSNDAQIVAYDITAKRLGSVVSINHEAMLLEYLGF